VAPLLTETGGIGMRAGEAKLSLRALAATSMHGCRRRMTQEMTSIRSGKADATF
jgi:hypothetical protein